MSLLQNKHKKPTKIQKIGCRLKGCYGFVKKNYQQNQQFNHIHLKNKG